jgi:hypothetical protein
VLRRVSSHGQIIAKNNVESKKSRHKEKTMIQAFLNAKAPIAQWGQVRAFLQSFGQNADLVAELAIDYDPANDDSVVAKIQATGMEQGLACKALTLIRTGEMSKKSVGRTGWFS